MRTWLAGSAENAVMRYPGRLRYFQAKWTLVEVEFKIVSETWDTPTYKLNSALESIVSGSQPISCVDSNVFRLETGYGLNSMLIFQ